MSAVVYKYPLASPGDDDNGRVTMAGEVVHVGLDGNGSACAWVYGPPELRVARDWLVVGTGWSVAAGFEHVGSWVQGEFVWHLMERVAS